MAPETSTSTAPDVDPGEQVPAPTAVAVAPRWAVRAEITSPDGERRDVTVVSDAEALPDAMRAALDVIDPGDGIITDLEGFEPRTISAHAAPGPIWSGTIGIPAGLAAALGAAASGPCSDPDCPEHGDTSSSSAGGE